MNTERSIRMPTCTSACWSSVANCQCSSTSRHWLKLSRTTELLLWRVQLAAEKLHRFEKKVYTKGAFSLTLYWNRNAWFTVFLFRNTHRIFCIFCYFFSTIILPNFKNNDVRATKTKKNGGWLGKSKVWVPKTVLSLWRRKNMKERLLSINAYVISGGWLPKTANPTPRR